MFIASLWLESIGINTIGKRLMWNVSSKNGVDTISIRWINVS